MRILHYIKFFSIPSETFIYNQIVNLEEREGIENYILTQYRRLEEERPFDKVLVVKDAKKSLLERAYHKINPRNKYRFKDTERFSEIIKRVAPDIIHAHFGRNAVFINNLLTKCGFKIPLVISFHGTDILSDPLLDPNYQREIKKLEECESIVFTAPTNFLKEKIQEYGVSREKIKIVPNTFNKNFSEVHKDNYFKYGDTFKVINVSRFVSWKGQRYLLEAFEKLVKNLYNNSELTFIGEGEEKEKIKKLAKRKGIREKVNFLGKVSHNKIPQILKEHDVYVQPSIIDEKTKQRESFGISVLEAIVVGLPVVVTNTGGMPEAIEEDNQQFSFIVPEKDSQAIYNVFKEMISEEYEFKDNNEYAQRVMEKYSPKKSIDSLINIYKNLL